MAQQKTKPVFGTVQQLRPDTSGHNLVVKARAGPTGLAPLAPGLRIAPPPC